MKNILITGGAGFIGSHLVKRLAEKNYQVTVIDNLERGKYEFIEHIKGINFINCDLTDYSDVKTYFEGKDVVIHLASKVSGIGKYLSNPYEIMNANIQMDLNVLKCVIEHKIPKYFYASSAHIYPKELQQVPDSPKIKETDAYPSNPELSYGWAKLIGEKAIESALIENKWLNASIARFIGIYGPHQDYDLETGSVIPVFTHRSIKYPKIPFSVWGTGKETRSYCHIDDALDCIELMVDKMDTQSLVGPYNVGRSDRLSIEEIANTVIEVSDKNIKIDWDPTKETVIWGQRCDVSKAKQELGWEAQITLKQGLKTVFNDIKNRLEQK